MAEVITLTTAQCETLAKVASDWEGAEKLAVGTYSTGTAIVLLLDGPIGGKQSETILIDPDGCFYFGEDDPPLGEREDRCPPMREG